MSIQLLIRQGGGAATEEDIADLTGREGLAVFEHNTPLIEMGQRWEQGSAAIGFFQHINPDADADYLFRPHASVKLVETATSPDTILAWGRIEGGNDTGRIATYTPGLEVRQSIQMMDCNLDLRGLPFATEWVRPAEDSWDRLQALFAAKLAGNSSTSTLHRATTNITCDRFTNGHLVDATDPVDLDAKTYPVGTEVEDILRDVMEQWGKGWGVTIHHTGGSHKCFLVQDYDDLAKFTSALKISDQVADWDPEHATTPVLEPKWARGDGKLIDQSQVISGLISIYGGTTDDPRHLYVETGEAPEDWEVWIGVYNDDLADNETQATRRANHILNDRKRPYVTNRPSILLEPTQVALITAGQAIQVKSVVINQNSAGAHDYVWRRIAEIRWEPNHDGRWWAHLELDRPRNSRPAAGGGQPGSTTPKPPPPPNPNPGDTVEKFYNANDAGGDAENWTGNLANQGGSADGALGTDYYNFKSTAPNNWQTTWAATDGAQYRVEGYVNSGNVGRLVLGFSSDAAGTNTSSSANIIEQHLISPVTPGTGNTWTFFTAGPYTAPTGTVSAALGRSGGSVSWDEVSIYLVGDPTESDEFAVDFGDHPHDSPYYLPSDYVESRLDEIEGDVPHIISDLDDVDEATPADGDVLTWNDANSEWEPAAGGAGAVATDTIWDAKGDLAAGTAADTAAKLTVGANGTFLKADSSQTTGLTWATAGSISITTGGNLGDVPPTSAGTYDEEFVGTADTLPTDWAWTSAPSGSDAWFLNSRWPSLLTVEGTGNTSYTLTRTSFTAASTFGIWAKVHVGPFQAADAADLRMYAMNSGATEGRCVEYRATGGRAAGVRGLRTISSAESVWGTEATGMATGGMHMYMGFVRSSNNFEAWYSRDGISWDQLAGSQSHTFTIDRLRFTIRTTSLTSLIGIDWLRYRTDLAFPRP